MCATLHLASQTASYKIRLSLQLVFSFSSWRNMWMFKEKHKKRSIVSLAATASRTIAIDLISRISKLYIAKHCDTRSPLASASLMHWLKTIHIKDTSYRKVVILEDPDQTLILFSLGTMVFANIWAMTHDEIIYPDPFSFKPERFFDENGKLNDDNRVLAYGFGTRQVILLATRVVSLMLFLTESV